MPSFCGQVCLRPRDRFWDIPVPKIDSAFDNLFVLQPSWSPSTTQQLRKLVAAPYLSPNDWTPRSEAYFVFPLAQGTPGKQCCLAAAGDYQPSLRSPWLAATEAVAAGLISNPRRKRPPRATAIGYCPIEGTTHQEKLWRHVVRAFPGQAVWEYPGAVPGRRFRLDITFPQKRLAIEVGGYAHHGKYLADFKRDRER
ncbi:hypothetical protein [Thiolapillus sp.]|uniref:hypothetical protein n=1 Tax=Thiolapillus sp. TaxID=2017437 RepID=UPI003AF6CC4E